MNQGRGGHESGAAASLTAAATGLGAAASRELLIASLAGGQDEPASPELISATLFAASTLFPGAQAAGSSTASSHGGVWSGVLLGGSIPVAPTTPMDGASR